MQNRFYHIKDNDFEERQNTFETSCSNSHTYCGDGPIHSTYDQSAESHSSIEYSFGEDYLPCSEIDDTCSLLALSNGPRRASSSYTTAVDYQIPLRREISYNQDGPHNAHTGLPFCLCAQCVPSGFLSDFWRSSEERFPE